MAIMTLEIEVSPADRKNDLLLPAGIKLKGFSLFDVLFGCNHNWSFPVTMKKYSYPAPFDGHQTCTDCGAERYYRWDTAEGGPLFNREVK